VYESNKEEEESPVNFPCICSLVGGVCAQAKLCRSTHGGLHLLKTVDLYFAPVMPPQGICLSHFAKGIEATRFLTMSLFERYTGPRFSVDGCRTNLPIKRFRGGLVFKAHRLLCLSTLGLRVLKKKGPTSARSCCVDMELARERIAVISCLFSAASVVIPSSCHEKESSDAASRVGFSSSPSLLSLQALEGP